MAAQAGSGYFHATLALSGELFDEWAILWVVMAALGMWCPDHWVRRIGLERRGVKIALFALTCAGTGVSMLDPAINHVLLFCFIVPGVSALSHEYSQTRNPVARRLVVGALAWFVFAVVCWVNDRLFCEFWTAFAEGYGLKYPQLHAFWHVAVSVGSYCGCVAMCFFSASKKHTELYPRLRYWPWPSTEFGVPYIKITPPKLRGKAS